MYQVPVPVQYILILVVKKERLNDKSKLIKIINNKQPINNILFLLRTFILYKKKLMIYRSMF